MRKLSHKEMREKGLCTRCGKENPTPEKSMCPLCSEKVYERRRQNRDYYRRINVCTRCGKNKAEPNKMLCMECTGREQDKYRLKKATETQKERDKLKKRMLSKERTEKGLCTKCGKQKAESTKMCGKCKAYQKKYRDKKRRGITRSERVSYGICYICGKNPVMDEKKVCEKCYEKRLKTLPTMWENRDNEYFKQLDYARISMIRSRRKEKKAVGSDFNI